MTIAITLRYDDNDGERFVISKQFKDIFDELNVTLIPICQIINLDSIVDICDALILTGSPIHVDAGLYNQEVKTEPFNYDKEDELDYRLIDLFIKKNKPILGICRGIQVLNVYFGGSLNQFINNHEDVMHDIIIEKDSVLSKNYPERIRVNSTHTQALDKVADGFKVIATTEDGVVEAIEKGNILVDKIRKDGIFYESCYRRVKLNCNYIDCNCCCYWFLLDHVAKYSK